MGRHSVPDDDSDVALAEPMEATAPLELAPHRGRHAAPDDETTSDTADAKPTQMIAVVDAELVEALESHDTHTTDELPGPPTAESDVATAVPSKAERKAARKAARGESGTAADLRLLRQRPIVRVQCVAVVLVAFGLYWLVMAVLGRTDAFVMWLWTPIVLAGVLVGLVLDLAHRREKRRTPPSP